LRNVERLAVCGPRAEVLGAVDAWRQQAQVSDQARLFTLQPDPSGSIVAEDDWLCGQ
jgi:hypothetical protein